LVAALQKAGCESSESFFHEVIEYESRSPHITLEGHAASYRAVRE
jgi:hypothetical protein